MTERKWYLKVSITDEKDRGHKLEEPFHLDLDTADGKETAKTALNILVDEFFDDARADFGMSWRP